MEQTTGGRGHWRRREQVPVDPSALRSHREQVGWTREKLAAELGLSYKTVERYETGARQPAAATVGQIARLLGIDVAALLDVRVETIPSFPRPGSLAREPDTRA